MHRVSRRTVSLIAIAVGLTSSANPARGRPGRRSCGASGHRGGVARPRPRPPQDFKSAGQRGAGGHLHARPARAAGFRGRLIPTPTPGKAHLIARLRSAHPTGKAVLLSRTPTSWASSPSCGASTPSRACSRGCLYGRGSFDDKGGIAVFATAAMRLARAHVPLNATSCSFSRPTRRAAITASSGSPRTIGTSSTPPTRSTKAASSVPMDRPADLAAVTSATRSRSRWC